jgi:hypothetical protein
MIRTRIVWPHQSPQSLDRNDGIIRPRRLDEIPLWSIILAVVMLAWMLTALTDRLWPAIDNNPIQGISSAPFA